ncbi:DUF6894 family protein [Enterovirga aerilata]|uniref:DUF6894 domain-containing protein n=1 Tax=Enterovirga aerilata TaxID=2730920 RepID=A0A849I4G4_9HYPH|nr:hypothetical protein [Enterovirga sp. DB1703]
MRCFFHVISADKQILDRTGVEVSSVEDARAQALQAISELRRENPSLERSWDGYHLNVVDDTGRTLFSLALTEFQT